MIYLLDTNTCIRYLNRRSDDIIRRMDAISPDDASIALAYDLIVVTHNTREFSRVEGLRLEDWEEGNVSSKVGQA